MADRKLSAGLDSVVPMTETLDPQIHQDRQGQPGRRKKWTAPALLVGERLADRFEIVRGLGQGGMGQVYEALDTELEQSVALKLIRPDLVLRPGVVERFKAEVRIAQRITHTNACRIFDFYQHRPTGDDGPKTSLIFLTMELLLGDTLADLLSTVEHFSVDHATAVLKQIASGLDAAHQADIVHGDLKPENIVFTGTTEPSRVVVTDFGLAFALGQEPDSDGTGGDTEHPALGTPSTPRFMGTPAYMAPELVDSAPSLRSDVFAFGLVALEMMTGRRKWKAATTVLQPSKSTRLITPKGLLRARRLAGTLPPRLGSLIQTCLEADPRDRPASAGEILERLDPGPKSTIADRNWQAEVGSVLPSREGWPFERLLNSPGDCQIWLARHAKTEEPRIFKLCDDQVEPTVLLRELTLLRLLRTELGRRRDLDRVLDWNFEGPTYFLEMEYSSAGDLVMWSESLGGLQGIPKRERMGLAADVAEALAAIHEIGIVHGDLRPEAVLVEEHQDGVSARLTGFGRGHLQDLRRLEVAGMTSMEVSTPGSENLADGKGALIDPRNLFSERDDMPSSRRDIRALGELLFQLAVGDLTQSIEGGWKQLVRDPKLFAIIESTVENPVDRVGEESSAADIAAQLRQHLDAGSLDRQARKRRNLAWLAAVVLLFAGSIVWMMTLAERQAVRARDAIRKAAITEWMVEDPTLAAATLLELEEPGPLERAMMRQALGFPLARVNHLPPGPVGRVAISPDGGIVALTSPETGILLWQTGLGETGFGAKDDLQLLGAHAGSVTELTFGPRGRRLLSTSRDNTARIWSLGTAGDDPGLLKVLRGHEDTIWRGAFDPQGTKVVTPSEDRTARVWTVDGSRKPVVLKGHDHWVIDARFDAEGRRVVTASRDGTVRVWNADGSGQPVILAGQTGGEEGWFFHAEFSPDGSKVVAASRDGSVMLWPADGAGEPVVLQGHTRSVEVASFRPDGRQVLSSSQDGTTRVWPTTGGSGRIVARTPPQNSTFATYARQGRAVLLSSVGGPILISTEPGGEPIRFLEPSAATGHKSNDDRWVLTRGDTLRIWPLDPDLWSQTLTEEETAPSAIGASLDGRRIALGSSEGTIRVIDSTGNEEAVLRGHGGTIQSLAFHPKTSQLASGSRDDTVRIWSLATPDEPVVLRGNEGTVASVHFHPQIDILVSAGFDGTVRFWNSNPAFQGDDSSRLVSAIPVSANGLASAVFGGSGDYLLATDRRSLIVLSFRFDGKAVVSEVVHRLDQQRFSWVDSSMVGTQFATVGGAGEITVWDLLFEDGLIREPKISNQWLDPDASRAYFDVDGRRLVVVGGSSAKIVDLDHPAEEPISLLGHDGQITGALFLPDGRLLTASADRTARIWATQNVDIREALDLATDFCIPPEVRRDRFEESEKAAERNYDKCRQAQRKP